MCVFDKENLLVASFVLNVNSEKSSLVFNLSIPALKDANVVHAQPW